MCMLGGASEGRRALARGERGGRMAAGGGRGVGTGAHTHSQWALSRGLRHLSLRPRRSATDCEVKKN